MMNKEPKGFSYYVDPEQIKRYREMPAAQKLRWLFCGNKLRKSLPEKTIAIQEAFREGER